MFKRIVFFSLMLISVMTPAVMPVSASSLGQEIIGKTKDVSKGTFDTTLNPRDTIFGGFGRAVNFLLGLLAVIAVGLVVYSGFLWLTAGGNDQQVSKAKNILKSVVIGLVIISVAYSLVTFVFRQISSGTPEATKNTGTNTSSEKKRFNQFL